MISNLVYASHAQKHLPQSVDSTIKKVAFLATNFKNTSIYDDPHGFFILKHTLPEQLLGKDLVIRFKNALN